ncbi:MAG: nucleotidyltransferase family protein [Bacteroidaceae bacterium]|nr:nucleotidyltransferase family protein [Bacteroidaceae bacterium]
MKSLNQTFVSLLRIALGNAERLDMVPTAEDWTQLMSMASAQGVIGVMFCGVERLPKEQMPPIEVIMDWLAVVDYVEQANRRQNGLCVKVCEDFRTEGTKMCVLKGQGMSVCYPQPLRRSNGDIDIWMSGGEVEVTKEMKRKFHNVKDRNLFHVSVTLEDGTELEAHFRPMRLTSKKYNMRLQQWVKKVETQQWNHMVELPERVGRIPVPTAEYNLVFILLHLIHHWAFEGCGMKQLVDYYWLVATLEKEERVEDLRTNAVKVLKELGFGRFLEAVMYIFKEWGMRDEYLLCMPNERWGRRLLKDILDVGIVSAFDLSDGKYGKETKIGKFWRRFWRLCRLFPLAPVEMPLVWWENVAWWFKQRMR